MRSKDTDRPSTELAHNIERNSLLVSTKVEMRRVLRVTTERYAILVRLNEYEASKEILEPNKSEPDVIWCVMTA